MMALSVHSIKVTFLYLCSIDSVKRFQLLAFFPLDLVAEIPRKEPQNQPNNQITKQN